jgi:hypothetical protein
LQPQEAKREFVQDVYTKQTVFVVFILTVQIRAKSLGQVFGDAERCDGAEEPYKWHGS